MNLLKKTILPVLLTTVWISISEFVRNEFLLKSFWINHFHNLGIEFPSAPVNGAVWGIWSLLFAIAIMIIAKKFNTLQTALLAWFMAFVMMWVVIGNLGVLPYSLLLYAIPLSLVEAFIAVLITRHFMDK